MGLHQLEHDNLFDLDALSVLNKVVKKFPEKIALSSMNRDLSFSELDDQSDRLAHGVIKNKLIERTEKNDSSYIGLLFDHDIELGIAVVGTFKAGYGYMPLDASYPEARLTYMLDTSKCELIITSRKLASIANAIKGSRTVLILEEVIAEEVYTNEKLTHNTTALSPAYLLFTSGSTGDPKGLMQTHRNLIYHTWLWVNKLNITQNDKLSLQSAYSWDSAVQDIFSALLTGATLCLVSIKEDGLLPTLKWMISEKISVYHSTVPIYRQVVRLMEEHQMTWSSLRMLAVGGDSVLKKDVDNYKKTFEQGTSLAYAYGSSESSTTLMKIIDNNYLMERNALPLGLSGDGAKVDLLDEAGNQVDEGEIVLTSAYVVHGYINFPADDERFYFRPDGQIQYRTGDLGVRIVDGEIALIGRKDDQVKIRGIRVLPGEVENALVMHNDIQETVVIAVDMEDERILVAYIVMKQGKAELNVSKLREYLKSKLPDHCVPSRFEFLPEVPLTVNGKIDKKALPDIGQERPVLEIDYVAPVIDVEKEIAGIWKGVLKINVVGIHDNFFDLGGHSVKISRVHALLESEMGIKVPLVQLFANPTIASLSRYLSGENNQSSIALDAASKRALKRKKLRRKKNEYV